MRTETNRTGRLRDRPRVRMGLSIVPSLFTIGNMFAGYYSVVSTLRGNYDYAAIAIGVGAVLDMLDGRIARMTNTSSEFGVELDSLADVLTFGIAPALLALHWGVGSLAGNPAEVARNIYKFGWLTTFGFLIAGALRLARFNLLARKPDSTGSKRHFVGLPIPAAAGVVAAVVHFWPTPLLSTQSAGTWCALMGTLAFLMISRVRYPSFKDADFRRLLPRTAIVATAMLIGLIVFYSEIVLLTIATIYASSGPVSKLSREVRRLVTGRGEVEVSPPDPDSHGDLT